MKNTLGGRIKELRLKLDWTQDKLANEAQISKGFLSDIENDKRMPGADNVLKISDALGASLDYLLRGRTGSENVKLHQVEIPRSLSEASQQRNWSYHTTLALLQVDEVTRFMRAKSMHWAGDWKYLYEALMKFQGSRSRLISRPQIRR